MKTRLISAATAIMAFTFLSAGYAWAQDFDPCAGLTGKAKGLCTAYSLGMGCSSDVPHATPEACASVATMLEEATGSPPPSECPCNFSLDRVRSDTEGWSDLTDEFTCVDNANLVSLRDSEDFNNMTAQVRGTNISIRCVYEAQTSQFEFNEEFLVPEEVSRRLEACRGAILTVAATVPLSAGSNCDL